MQKEQNTTLPGSNTIANICLLLNSLLLFLLIMGDRLAVPGLLQVAGRMHPLILHFPIVLLLLYVIYFLFVAGRKSEPAELKKYADAVLLAGALTAALAALVGLFLSREEGYDADALAWHKYGGAAISVLAILWYYNRNMIRSVAVGRFSSSAIMLVMLIMTGHDGANITHGEGFLLAPIQSDKAEPAVPLADAVIYKHIIEPIFESKCMSCHNSQKAKGELIMETRELLLKGGKSGKLWDHSNPGSGLLLERLWLPLEAKKHMPPKGKPQLSAEELELLQRWVAAGAPFDDKLTSLPGNDSLYLLAAARLGNSVEEDYDFPAADASLIRSLNSENRVVMEEAVSSPAIQVQFFNSSQFKSEQLNELSKINKQIVSLDLTRMPLNEKDLQSISKFENLRKLNLSFTGVKGEWLKQLASLKQLKSLSLSGTSVATKDLAQLKNLSGLQQVFVWQTSSPAEDWKKLQKEFPQLAVETGFAGDSIKLKLSPPVLQNEVTILTEPTLLKLKHYINGAEIRYTLDGSEPDSIRAAVYKGDEIISTNVLIKARAYKPGWYSSDILEANLYKRSVKPDTVILETAPESVYAGKPGLLTDLVKGETNFRDGNWMAWRSRPMELLLPLPKNSKVSSVAIGSLIDVGSYIMPPTRLEVWGGKEPGSMRKLGEIKPEQPTMAKPSYLRGFECKFEPAEVNYLRLIGIPVQKLPSWHPGKGDKGWLFIDEILIN